MFIHMFLGPDKMPSTYSCSRHLQASLFRLRFVLYFGILAMSMVQVKVLLGMTSSHKQQWRC